jgi:hypothetical protein
MNNVILWAVRLCILLKIKRRFGVAYRLYLQGGRIRLERVKAGGKQSNGLSRISCYFRERREIEDSKSISVGSPAGQKETAGSAYLSTLKMEAVCSTEATTVKGIQRVISRNIGIQRFLRVPQM